MSHSNFLGEGNTWKNPSLSHVVIDIGNAAFATCRNGLGRDLHCGVLKAFQNATPFRRI